MLSQIVFCDIKILKQVMTHKKKLILTLKNWKELTNNVITFNFDYRLIHSNNIKDYNTKLISLNTNLVCTLDGNNISDTDKVLLNIKKKCNCLSIFKL